MKTFKTYVTPDVEVQEIYSGKIMIGIGSGDTSPEESDSNESFFEEDNDESTKHAKSLWDD